MKLTYRSLPYQRKSRLIETIETGIKVKFRSLPYILPCPLYLCDRAVSSLKYRGANYIKFFQTPR
jgi:Domain of unknown function (DUF4278)